MFDKLMPLLFDMLYNITIPEKGKRCLKVHLNYSLPNGSDDKMISLNLSYNISKKNERCGVDILEVRKTFFVVFPLLVGLVYLFKYLVSDSFTCHP